MPIIENFNSRLEQLAFTGPTSSPVELPDVVKNSILEAVNCNNIEATITRIDNYLGERPPHGINENAEVAKMLGNLVENIDPRYLEAPEDMIQVKECAEKINQIKGSNFVEWQNLDVAGRANVLAEIEGAVATVAHRNPCPIVFQPMAQNRFGYYDQNNKTITLNSFLLENPSEETYSRCIETVLHEGRHAYQDYNLTIRQVHADDTDIKAWRANDYGYGYLDVETYGFETYSKQPVEMDARDFASHVLEKMRGQHVSHIHEYTQADVDYFAKQVRITSGSEQAHWLDRYNWALKHLH